MKRDLGDGYELDDDPDRIDLDAVHDYLANESYWARGRPRETVERLVRGATRVVGLYRGGPGNVADPVSGPGAAGQVGFARAVSDGVVFAYLADVYVLPEHRGRGLGVELVREMVENGPLAGLRWILHTRDAHGLYQRFGFAEPDERLLERPRPGTGAAVDDSAPNRHDGVTPAGGHRG
jgi:GNAT superfamily N-acetyltransferase